MNMLVVIDSRVEAYPMLAAGVRNGAKVIVIDPNFDGIEQITRSLAQHPASSLHIVCHGKPGTLYLGKTPLNATNLETYRHQLQQWHVTDILLYACNVAVQERSSRRETNNPSATSATNLLQRLHQLTGANIAASNQRVGSTHLGGDWKLEVQIGEITTPLAFLTPTLSAYPGVFAEDFMWAKGMGGGGNDSGTSIAVDSSGNVYTTGFFQGTADFDPGSGTTNLIANSNLSPVNPGDIFVTKLDSKGNLVSAKNLGGSGSIVYSTPVVDSSGNVYTTGYFFGTADFNPGAGITNLTAKGSIDIFVTKLDNNGNLAWAKVMEGNLVGTNAVGQSIALDSSGNVYITGWFGGIVDFDPSAGITKLTSNALGKDIFVTKLNSSGNLVWAKAMGGNFLDSGRRIAVDSSSNVYITGDFSSPADFDPGPGTTNLTSTKGGSFFVTKLDSSGNLAWAKDVDFGSNIAVDSSSHVYTTGSFFGTFDFDPGAGIANLTSNGSSDIFVTQFDSKGNLVWAKNFGGTGNDSGNSIAVDSNGNAYITGSLNGATDSFIKLDSSGNLVWTQSLGGAGNNIAIDKSDNLYITGSFNGTADFDPGAGIANLTSNGGSDIFVTKLDNSLPTISINNPTIVEGTGGSKNLTFSITLSDASTVPISVDYFTVDGTATAGSDYEKSEGTVKFTPGSSLTQTISIPITTDNINEADETFYFQLSNAVNANISSTAGKGTSTIINDDTPTISITNVSLKEGNSGKTDFTFDVTLSNPTDIVVTVDYFTVDGTATISNNDYISKSGTLTFNADDSLTQSITVEVIGDKSVEQDEVFNLILSTPKNATIAGTGEATGSIINDDAEEPQQPTPTVSISPALISQFEGNSGTTAYTYTVSLSNPSLVPITVNYSTNDGSATVANIDYADNDGSLPFAPGSLTKTITVQVTGDTEVEPDENFTVKLNSASNATIDTTKDIATGIIKNDDDIPIIIPSISINDIAILEGTDGVKNAVFTVELSSSSILPISVNYATSDGTAKAGSDYTAILPTSLIFAPGEIAKTVTVAVNPDSLDEPDETFNVNLTDATNAIIADNTGVATILDDDDPVIPVINVAPGQSPSESGPTLGTFIISLNAAAPTPITVNFNTNNSTATLNTDYTFDLANSTNITAVDANSFTIAAGVTNATLAVKPVDDTENETNGETIQINLEPGTNYRLGYRNSAVAQFAPPTYFTGGGNSAVLGDFNNDGFLDLATTGGFIHLGKGDGSFDEATKFSEPGFSSITTGDFNGDGFLDLAMTLNSGDSYISVFLGKGDGSFGSATDFFLGLSLGIRAITVGDFNADGNLDLATANAHSNANNVSVVLGTGTGSFSAATNFSVGDNPLSIVSGDFNSDGLLDLAIANRYSHNVSVLLGIGGGSFSSATNFTVGTGPHSIASEDFNGDGFLDLATANTSSGNVSVLLGTGGGSFSSAANFAVGDLPLSITSGDFNGDGFSDLVTGRWWDKERVSVLLGKGDGNFDTGTKFSVFPEGDFVGLYALTAGDLNKDGFLDLVVPSSTIAVLLNNNQPTATLTIGDNDTVVTIAAGTNPNELNSTNGTFVVNLNGPAPIGGLTVNYNLGGSATNSADYQLIAGSSISSVTDSSFTIAAGATSATLKVAPIDDNAIDSGEMVEITLTPGTDYTLGAENNATLTITDNDPVINISASGSPSELGSINGTFNITLNAAVTVPVTVKFNTTGSAASFSTDYTFDLAASTNITAIDTANNTFTLAPGVTSATLAIKPLDDAEVETGGETVQINLQPGTGYSLGYANGAVAQFAPPINFALEDSPNFIAVGDFNSDGNLDLVTANPGSNNVSVFLGAGDGSFSSPTNFSVGSEPRSVAVADFNDDGKLDLLTANFGSNDLSVLLGTGDGGFGEATNFAVETAPLSVAVGDFNGDGKLDLASPNVYLSLDNLSVLLGTGDGSFGKATNLALWDYLPWNYATSITAGDFNKDGFLDLATANSLSSSVSVLVGMGDGNFGKATNFPVPFGTGSGPVSVAAGDFNGDGFLDLATTANDFFVSAVSVLLNNGDGSFGEATNFPSEFPVGSVSTGDFNGDGKLDLVISPQYLDNFAVLLGTGDGSFSEPTNFPVEFSSFSFATGDFNNDGLLDLAATNGSVFLNSNTPTATLTIADNDSVNNDLPTVTLASGASPSESGSSNGTFIITLDTPAPSEGLTINFNITGSTANNPDDYIFDLESSTNITAIDTSSFTIAPGVTSATLVLKPVDDAEIETGGETVQLNLDPGVGYRLGYGDTAVAQFAPETSFNVGSFPSAVTKGDFNQDGFTDLVTANQFSDDVSIILGMGDGTFGSATNFSVGSFPIAVTSGDFNQDSFLDLAAVNEFSDNISVLLGTGDGSFGSATNFSVGFDPVSVTAKDLNQDSFIDLVATNFGDNNVSVLLNAKDGSFATATNFSVGSGPSSVTAEDFNQDGFLDLATANFNTNDVSILLGTGDGNFGSASNFSVGLAPNSVTAGDFNQDGFLDLVTANQNSDNLSVLLGTGDGSFGTATNLAVEFGPGSVATSDFNGDGFLDLAATNLYSNNVSILLGTGDGNFGAATSLAVGSNPTSIVVDDFNKDGKPDLATANQSSDSVSVLLNNNIPTASLTIADNDPVSVEFSAASYQVNEDGTIVGAAITINRIGDAQSPASVQVQLTNGTASGGSQPFDTTTDFDNTIQTINFASGETSQIVTIPINNDNWVEGNEDLTLTLINPSANLVLGTQTTTNLTIVDNDVAEISLTDDTVVEGNSGTTNAIFTVTLSNPSTQAVTVNYNTSDDTATVADGDYMNIPATLLTFNPGEISKTITVAVNGDEKVEGDETFNLNLSNATNATIVDNKGVAIITNDDVSPIVNNVSSTALDGNYTVGQVIPITVTFSKNVFVSGTPQLTLETGTTDAVANYISGSGSNTLTFNYRVGMADTTADLDYISTNALVVNGGTIKDAVGNDAVLDLPVPGTVGSLGANKAIAIPPINNIIGTAGRDTLTGTSGRDRIVGEQVSDTVTGGLGNDEFVYNRIQDAGDFIMDFQVGSDKIVMTNLLASLGYSGSNAIADGYVSFSARGSDAIVNLDPDGFAGTSRSRLYITLKNVSVAALNHSSNFIFD